MLAYRLLGCCCAVLAILGAAEVRAQDAAGSAPPAKLSSRFIPDDALGCLFLYPEPVLQAEEMKLMPTEIARAWSVENIGIDFANVEYIVAVAGVPVAGRVEFGFGVTLNQDFDAEKLNPRLFAAPAASIDGYQARLLADSPDLLFHQVGPRAAVIATQSYLAAMVEADQGTGPLPKLVRSLPQVAPAMAALVVEPVRAQLNQVADQVANQLPPPLVGVTQVPDLLDAVVVAAGLRPSDKFRLMMLARDEQSATELENITNNALTFGRDIAVAQSMQQVQGTGPVPEATRAYIQRLSKEIVNLLTPRRDGRRLMIEVDNQGGLATTGVLVGLLLPAVQSARAAARRMASSNNLKQILLAFHNYHDTFGHFPEPISRDADGKPLLSWRVAILPFIEQRALYDQFRLDEAWDSEHNAQLVAQMPSIYAHPSVELPQGETIYHAVVGDGLALKSKGATRMAEVTDGLSNTIAIVEVDAESAVPWTKPSDVEIDLANPLAHMGKALPQGFNVALMDGAVKFMSNSIDPAMFAAMLTRAGGEIVNFNR